MNVATPGSRLPAWAEELLPPVVEAARRSDGQVGVWRIEGDRPTAVVSDQFKADAGAYHARFGASAHFKDLFKRALEVPGFVPPPEPLILDLGSGSGVNSIFPCFDLFPGAKQVATDLSAELLAILAEDALAAGVSDRVVPVVMDAMSRQVIQRGFDMVTGGAILHHLVNPKEGVAAAAWALKPGGFAIFHEPFDGYGVVRLAFERILAEAELRRSPLPPEVARGLTVMIRDIAARTMPDKTAPGFADLDDKWLLSRENVIAWALACGFGGVRFIAHHDHPTLYRDMAAVQVRLVTGVEDVELPAWALDILDAFDRALPPPVKRLLALETTIVLRKGAEPFPLA